MIHVMTMRFSQALDSSTVRPEREKFIISKATAAVTMAAIVEILRIWVYTSFMMSLAFDQIVVAAEAVWERTGMRLAERYHAYSQRQGFSPRFGAFWVGADFLDK